MKCHTEQHENPFINVNPKVCVYIEKIGQLSNLFFFLGELIEK